MIVIVVIIVTVSCATCYQADIDVTNQTAIDQLMLQLDGTENKCKSFLVHLCHVNCFTDGVKMSLRLPCMCVCVCVLITHCV